MAEGEPDAGERLLGRILVASGAAIGVLSGLCTSGGVVIFLMIVTGGVLRPGPGAPSKPDWLTVAATTLAPFQFGAIPLALAGVLIYSGRRMLRARRSRALGWLSLVVGALTVTACLLALATRSSPGVIALPIVEPGVVLLGLGALELRRTEKHYAER